MRSIRIAFYISLPVTVACFILSAFTVIASPGFRWAPVVSGVVCVFLCACILRQKGIHIFIVYPGCAFIIACIFLSHFIGLLINPRERHAEHISPAGTTTVVIEYDFASRPRVYRRQNALFMSRIPFTFGPGYNQTVNHTVTWLSENKIRLEDSFGGIWDVNIR